MRRVLARVVGGGADGDGGVAVVTDDVNHLREGGDDVHNIYVPREAFADVPDEALGHTVALGLGAVGERG